MYYVRSMYGVCALGSGCIGDWDSILARVLRKSLVSVDMEIHFPVVLVLQITAVFCHMS